LREQSLAILPSQVPAPPAKVFSFFEMKNALPVVRNKQGIYFLKPDSHPAALLQSNVGNILPPVFKVNRNRRKVKRCVGIIVSRIFCQMSTKEELGILAGLARGFFTDTNVGKGFGSEPQREKLERNRMKENLAEDDPASFGTRL
jgi:hypothetical protein